MYKRVSSETYGPLSSILFAGREEEPGDSKMAEQTKVTRQPVAEEQSGRTDLRAGWWDLSWLLWFVDGSSRRCTKEVSRSLTRRKHEEDSETMEPRSRSYKESKG